MKRLPALALAAIGLTGAFVVTAGTGVAIGSGLKPVNDAGTISSCVRAVDGGLRIANSTDECKGNELPLTWQQESSGGGAASVEYVDVTVTIPAEADDVEIYHARCPAGTNVVSGTALRNNGAVFRYADYPLAVDGAGVWAFEAEHMSAEEDFAPEEEAAQDATIDWRLVCIS